MRSARVSLFILLCAASVFARRALANQDGQKSAAKLPKQGNSSPNTQPAGLEVPVAGNVSQDAPVLMPLTPR
jgi:hypothetical protein